MSLRMPNSCFTHIPRTGGMWVKYMANSLGLTKQQLNGDIDSHLCYQQLPDNWKALKSFSIIRHPYSWVESRWSHALEINACEEYRHYGIHRLFDECVRETLEETIITIIKKQPKLVLRTFVEMSAGVSEVFRTIDISQRLYQFLHKNEGITQEHWDSVVCDKINSTTTLEKYKDKANVSPSLIDDFLALEHDTLKWWESCG